MEPLTTACYRRAASTNSLTTNGCNKSVLADLMTPSMTGNARAVELLTPLPWWKALCGLYAICAGYVKWVWAYTWLMLFLLKSYLKTALGMSSASETMKEKFLKAESVTEWDLDEDTNESSTTESALLSGHAGSHQ